MHANNEEKKNHQREVKVKLRIILVNGILFLCIGIYIEIEANVFAFMMCHIKNKCY